MESEIAKYFATIRSDCFREEYTSNRLHFEVLYEETNSNNTVIIPGDTAPAWMYRDLANTLFDKGSNVFSMNYNNFDKSQNLDPRLITSRIYLSNLIEVKALIEKNYNINDLIFVGHSRGCEIIQMYLENNKKSEKVALLSPLFGIELGKPPVSISLLIRMLPKLLKNGFRFSAGYHTHRFFEKGVFSNEKLNCAYENSSEIPLKLSLTLPKINYSDFCVSHEIFVISPKYDIAIDSDYQIRCVEKLRLKPAMDKLRQELVDGSHFYCIEHPHETADLILSNLS